MRPTNLQLKNFLSYRGQHDIDLSGLQLTAITGGNGHGKSAILDAITWALFGEARKSGSARKPDADVLNRRERQSEGDAQMEVQLTFRSGDQHYRIERSYRETATGKTTQSDLQFFNQTAGRDLTAGSQRETQQEITDVLGMNYELFANTSLMEQGRWNRLMTATPAERKDLLFELLRLGRFDEDAESARAKRRDVETKIETKSAEAERLADELEGHEEREEKLQTLREREEAQRSSIESLEQSLEEMREEAQQHCILINKRESLQDERQRVSEQINDAVATIERAEESITKLQKDARDILDGQDRSELEELARGAEPEAESELEVVRYQLEQKTSDLEDAESSQERAETARERAKDLSQRIEDLQGRREAIQEPEPGPQDLREQKAALSSTIKQKEARIESLEQEIAGLEPGDDCPRCGQTVGEDHLEDMGAEELERLIDEVNQTRDRMADLETQIQEAEQTLEEVEEIETEIESAEQELREAERIVDENAGADDRAEELRAEIYKLEQREEELEQKVRAAQDAAEAEDKLDRLEEVDSKICDLESSKRDAKDRKQELDNRCQEIVGELQDLDNEIEDYEDAPERVSEHEDKLTRKREQARQISNERARLQTRVEDDQQAAQELEHIEVQLKRLRQRRQALSDLSSALGRDGIPTMLLKSAIPRIEERANEMLYRLTDGEYQIRLDTTRETQDGSETGTLRIVVLNEGTERPYEGLSGGERFRTAFALRVALSQHLAARTGRPVSTLVIDEGFGTQDPQGLRAIKETIAEVANDFDLVLAITHVEALKNAFPQRLAVSKNANGSSVNLHNTTAN